MDEQQHPLEVGATVPDIALPDSDGYSRQLGGSGTTSCVFVIGK